jgi:hypothetical protein
MRKLMLLTGAALAIAFAVLTAPRPLAQSFNAAAGTVPAPDPNVPLYFEAASVKPSDPSNPPGQGIRRQPGGRFNTFNTPVRTLITFAYQIQGYQLVGGPDWLNGERFDIVAKMEGDPPAVVPGTGADHMMLATRTLLADRFKLKVHKETRELDIYALTMAKPGGKPGPKLIPARGGCSPDEIAARRGAASGLRDPAGSRSHPVWQLPVGAVREKHRRPRRTRRCRSDGAHRQLGVRARVPTRGPTRPASAGCDTATY